ncbi:TM1812 family CRISPR-associated protein [Oceanivirga salmonicida]|uniref:TM1812 family CRISPR-associated protein n=1 Tax=Oceanivirga salmonicida TaxID=1769291 RepID=UPI0012E1C2C2|nr:TM1812 family CRISPR-associated protein [Oceanivirga salmonicida]
MSKILILTLTNRIGERESVSYEYKGKEYKNYDYFLELIIEKENIDSLVLIGTLESSWEYVYKIFCKQKNIIFDENVYNELKNIKLKKITDDEKKQMISGILNEIFLDKLIPIIYFEKEHEQNFEKIMKKISQLNQNDEIYIDITGGKRDLSIFLMLFIDSISSVENINPSKINLLCCMKNKDIVKIENITKMYEFISYINATRVLVKYGISFDYVNLIKKSNNKTSLLKMLENINLLTEFNFEKNIIKKLNEFNESIGEIEYAGLIEEKIIKKYVENRNNINKDNVHLYNLENENLGLAVLNYYNPNDGSRKKPNLIRNQILHVFTYESENNEKFNYRYIKEIMDNIQKKHVYNKRAKEKKRILISSLGERKTHKDDIVYSLDNKDYKANLPFMVLDDVNKYDKVIVIGTKDSSWELLNKEREYIEIILENYDNVNEIISNVEKVFEEILNEINDNSVDYEIIMDFTNSYRIISILNILILHLFENLFDNIKVTDLYYAEVNELNNKSIIKNANKIKDIQYFEKLVNEYFKYSKYSSEFNKMKINEKLRTKMKKISENLSINNIKGTKAILKKINSEIKVENISEYDKRILKKINELFKFNKVNSDRENYINIVKAQYKMHQYGLVLNNLRELYNKYIYETTDIEKIESINKYDEKLEKIGEIINKNRGISVHHNGTKKENIKEYLEIVKNSIEDAITYFEDEKRIEKLKKRIKK